MEKTQGMMVGSSCTEDRLPSIKWQNQSIKILGFQIGNVNPKTIGHDSLEGLKKQKLLINVPFQTWQAKSLLAKSKLLPQITYNAHTYPLETTTQNMIETPFCTRTIDILPLPQDKVYKNPSQPFQDTMLTVL